MLVAFVVILGLAIGSFLNVLVLRLQAGRSLAGRSHCPHCQHQLPWYHNIPVLSFLALKGRCAYCREFIAWQYPVVELATAGLFLMGVITLTPADWLTLATYLVVASFAIALFVYDLRFKLLPDSLTLPAVVLTFMLNLWRGVPYWSLLLGLVVAGGFFALQFWFSRGRWLGAGDIRLGLWLGAALGWPLTAVALVLAYWAGAVVGLSLVLLGRRGFKSELPFGTFLTSALVVCFLWGQAMLEWYLRILGF